MLIELESICKADAIIVLVFFGMHDVVIDGLDVHISDVISKQYDFVAMDFFPILP